MDRIRRGKSFGGVVAYALKSAPHHLQVPFVIGGNTPGTTVDEPGSGVQQNQPASP